MEKKEQEANIVSNEYIGPTRHNDKPLSMEFKTHGRDEGCAACRRADAQKQEVNYIRTSYVAMGVKHDHVYIANFGV